jgi:hypothetical protein
VFADQLRDPHAGFRLLEHRNDLFFTEPGLLHKSSPVGKLYSRVVLFVRGLQFLTLYDATAITDTGYILAQGYNSDSGLYKSYLLQAVAPVPLPAAAWLMISALGGLGATVRRKRHALSDSTRPGVA